MCFEDRSALITYALESEHQFSSFCFLRGMASVVTFRAFRLRFPVCQKKLTNELGGP